MMFDWDDLRYFLLVARTGRLTVAAKHMGTDHTTVSRRIQALERDLGANLFDRSPRGYSLTPTGERLLERAESIEASAAGIQNDISGERFSLVGTVRIGAPDGFGAAFLAPRLPQFTNRHPELQIELVALPRIFSLSKREADIAIGLERPHSGRLYSRKLTDYTLHLYASKQYLAAHAPIDKMRDLHDHPIIGYIPEFVFSPKLDYLKEIGDGVSPRFSSTNLIAQLAATRAGGGLCILPDFLTRDAPDLVPILAEKIELTRNFWIMAHLDLRETARIKTVIGYIADIVKEQRRFFVNEQGS